MLLSAYPMKSAYSMKTAARLFASLAFVTICSVVVSAQADRPIPYPVFEPPQFGAAVASGTRMSSGEPGPNHWQNSADYTLHATLNPAENTLAGEGTIVYHNNSPDALAFLVLKLRQNVHAEGVPRNRFVAITGGLHLDSLSANGRGLEEVSEGLPEPGQYVIQGTILTLALPDALASGSHVELELAWNYTIPPHTGSFRQGQDGEVYYIGYWYPQLAVYDDVYGWNTDQYMGLGEHYMGYGDYDVSITAPEGWLVYSTGSLENIGEVLTAQTIRRLAQAASSNEVVRVVTETERRAGISTLDTDDDLLTWRFKSERVRDVAFAASPHYLWDATRAMVDQDGDGNPEAVQINSFYRPGAASWERSAEFSAFSIGHLSELIRPYPYPHMTAVEGIIGGGMEYPMMTLIGGARNDQSLFGVTYHEIGHMWFPMVVGQNEKAFTWMDEGLTSYNTNEGIRAFFDGSAENRPEIDAWDRNRQSHYFLAGTGLAIEPMRHNDHFPLGGGTQQVDPVQNASRGVASYSTPAVLLHAIEGMFGRERFLEAYRTYAERWAYKHPYPYDLFNTFEDVLGEDLDWLWTPTLFETWTVDHGITSVDSTADGVQVSVTDYGLAPMPAIVVATYASGATMERRVEHHHWLTGARSASVTFAAGDVTRVEIDPGDFMMDVDRTNNVWTDEQAVIPGN